MPTPGVMMRTRVTVSSKRSPPGSNPKAMIRVMGRANTTATATINEVSRISSPAMAPASRPASSSRPSAMSRL